MERSEQLNELAAALARAQSSIDDASKSREGQARGARYRYATLGDVWDACRGPLSENGLAVVQYALPSDPGMVLLATMLLHSSGQFITGVESIPIMGEANPQTYGSAMTYARRYGLAAMVGIVSDDDDDGAAASQQKREQQFRPPARQQLPTQNTERRPATAPESTPRPAPAPHTAPAAEAPSLACSRPGCGHPLTKGQHDVSVRAFGQPLCPQHQKEQARGAQA